jgi:hypothetical protein
MDALTTAADPAPWWMTTFWLVAFAAIFSPLLIDLLRLG